MLVGHQSPAVGVGHHQVVELGKEADRRFGILCRAWRVGQIEELSVVLGPERDE